MDEPGKARRQRLPAEQRRRAIIAAARDLFIVHGLDGTKTRQIADAAGVTETVLYRHFESKDDIFQQAILSRLEDLCEELLAELAGFADISARERFELSEDVHRQMYKVISEITPLLGIALFSNRAAGELFWREQFSPMIMRMTKALTLALGPRQKAFIDPRTLFLVFFGMHFGVALDSGFRHTELDLDALADDVTTLVAFGIVSSPTTLR